MGKAVETATPVDIICFIQGWVQEHGRGKSLHERAAPITSKKVLYHLRQCYEHLDCSGPWSLGRETPCSCHTVATGSCKHMILEHEWHIKAAFPLNKSDLRQLLYGMAQDSRRLSLGAVLKGSCNVCACCSQFALCCSNAAL